MIDHSAKAYVRYHAQQRRGRLGIDKATRLESKLARSYTDDVDVRRGALSAPCNSFRPGQRDDEPHCMPSSMVTIM
jgi:hypothetical protein